MRKFELVCTVNEFNSIDELSDADKVLIAEANRSLSAAYAPYSGFRVGCALLLDDGTIICGNNQENAAYPSGLCAERVAFFYAGANYPGKKIKTVAITTADMLDNPVAPCGACRQVMAEYESKQHEPIRLLLAHAGKNIYIIERIADLLPIQFVLNKSLGS